MRLFRSIYAKRVALASCQPHSFSRRVSTDLIDKLISKQISRRNWNFLIENIYVKYAEIKSPAWLAISRNLRFITTTGKWWTTTIFEQNKEDTNYDYNLCSRNLFVSLSALLTITFWFTFKMNAKTTTTIRSEMTKECTTDSELWIFTNCCCQWF